MLQIQKNAINSLTPNKSYIGEVSILLGVIFGGIKVQYYL